MMAGCLDLKLGWGVANALTEITGDFWVDDLAEGESRLVYVDHSASPLALANAAVVSPSSGVVEGLLVEPVAVAEVDAVMRTTDGDGFLLRVSVPTGVIGADQGRGTGAADWHLYWSRSGVGAIG